MRVCVDGRTVDGRALDLTGVGAPPEAFVRAVQGAGGPVTVDCPAPAPVHDHVAMLPPPSRFDRRAALADAARALGHTSPDRRDLEAARADLRALPSPSVDVREARRRVAESGAEEDRLRERVAELRGRLQARRDVDADTTAVEAQLDDAVRRLSEAETDRIAAEQALERAEEAARSARDRRERRLELEDRVANLERAVRADLAAAVWERFRSALEAVPGAATAGPSPGAYDGEAATAALAVARLAPIDAPIVVADRGRFDGAATAARALHAPVIYTG
jgi:hypothetical protein